MSTKKPFIPDYKQTQTLVKAGKNAATNAVRQSKALDLPITYIDNGVIYREDPEGEVIVVGKMVRRETPIAITKGMVLHAKSK